MIILSDENLKNMFLTNRIKFAAGLENRFSTPRLQAKKERISRFDCKSGIWVLKYKSIFLNRTHSS